MSPIQLPESREDAVLLDRADPLASRRDLFALPPDVTYLVGHSLGPAAHSALQRVQDAAARDWADGLVRSWNSAGWIDLPARVGARLAELIGARSHEVVVCDSVTVNLFKLAVSTLPLAGHRSIAVCEDEFPTDRYIAKGMAEHLDIPVDIYRRKDEPAVLAKGGVVLKSAVHFRDGLVADMTADEAVVAASGGVIIWDLSHATGVMDLALNNAGARFAVGCTYKYLNGGPGAPSFLYAREDVADRLRTPLPGWLGHAEPFAFAAEYEPAEGVARFVAGTPNILSLAALDGALDAFDGVSLGDLRHKAMALGALCVSRAEAMGLQIQCPADPADRGGHVSLSHPDGYAVVQALAADGILADFRTPTTIRFGFSPLFISHTEVWDMMDRLQNILDNRLWDRPEFKHRQKVT
ncbi:kynureninase [Parvularcula sp. LCG005]|uniref:kynureninase n=1 Tax=Parvularcula sp. LCG005 TaxID=3078805 RepID=UPI0029428521|nr:aminotransferase class V-fold PLP-dependent enzyme [Parvularcula sp. LCG005]WOI52265.1 aminotransferase class V-fold PLP-dependent enzyme [Parvularcula sp. LCG005]